MPDVEIFRRLVAEPCRGRVVARADVFDRGILEGISPEALAQRLAGRRIMSSERYGKYLFIGFAAAGVLAMHFGTNGSLRLFPEGATAAATRLALQLADGSHLAYVNPRRLGWVSLWESPAALVAHLRLGPDALDARLDAAAFAAILGNSRRNIKALLMDQQRLAGIGNIYSDEILFQARVNPGRIAADLDRETVARLFHAMRETLQTAIRCGAGAEQATERLPPDFLLPHRHPGGRCPRCGALLASVKRAGRTAYHCPHCQPAG